MLYYNKNKCTNPLKVFAIIFLILTSSLLKAQDKADLVLNNGKIITVDSNDTIAEAIAIKNGLILKVGSNSEIQSYIDQNTQVLDLLGKTVTPGMIDAHSHLMYYGQAENDFVNVRPPEVTTIQQVLDKLQERINLVGPEEWVIGDGFFQLTDGRLPTLWDLDPISPNNPVFLNSIGGHFGTANSKAFEIAGIDEETPNPVGGIIDTLVDTGELTGILWNHPAMDLVRIHYPPFDVNDMIDAIVYAQDKWIQEGITSFQDVNTRALLRYQAYRLTEDSLKVRGYLLYTIERSYDAKICLEYTEHFSSSMLTYNGVKFLLDGQPPTSYTYEPHVGPSWNLPTWNPDTLQKVVIDLHRAGHQLAFHVMGDAAIDLALDVIEAALNDTPREDHRHRLEHLMIPRLESIDRMKDLGVIASLQPGIISISGDYYPYYWGERTIRFKPMKTLLDKGVKVALGSDYPTVTILSPLNALYSAVARKTQSGAVLSPGERVTIQEALRAHTIDAAYAAFEDDVKGSLEEGKYADMVVWSDDLYTVETDEIPNIKADYTIVGGKVYDNTVTVIESPETGSTPPTYYELYQNFPNPFNPKTLINVLLPESTNITLVVYDLLGRKIKVLADGEFDAGKYTFEFEADYLSTGIYFYTLKSNKYYETKKMVIMK
ncbi:amidohydrolase family protein [Bacteroidota bacterium]